MIRKDGRLIAKENEYRCLRALHRFGWLRTQDLAVLCWTAWAKDCLKPTPVLASCTPSASALRMAQRTLQRLRKERAVICSKAPNGSIVYALAEAGVRALSKTGVLALSGKDLMRFSAGYFRHRTIANQIAISCIVQGYKAATEREISQGLWSGGLEGVSGKKPDVLIRDRRNVWHWVEVERSRKNKKDYDDLLRWLTKIRLDSEEGTCSTLLPKNCSWGKVIFVCTKAFEKRIKEDLIENNWKINSIDALITFETTLYNIEDVHILF